MLAYAHQRVHGRRVEILARHIAELLPHGASVLDVGSGDGMLAARIGELRPDTRIAGVDVLVRPESRIRVQSFDGTRLPFANDEFDAILLVDVLHHAREQQALLSETARVARRAVIIKDHSVRGTLARPTLRFMDWVGNARHGVSLPYSYWTPAQWEHGLSAARLRVTERRDRLGLYPWPASLIFERSLHFIAVLEPLT